MDEARQELLDRIQELDAEIERLQFWVKWPEFSPIRYGGDCDFFRQELDAKRALRLRLIGSATEFSVDEEWISSVKDCARDLALRVLPFLNQTTNFKHLFVLAGADGLEEVERWRKCFYESALIQKGKKSSGKYPVFAHRVRRLVELMSDPESGS